MFRVGRLSIQTTTRAFSTAAAKKVSHEPPKKIHGRTGRYAMAVYTAASKANVLDKVEAELSAFHETVKKNNKIGNFLENPTIPRAEKSTKVKSNNTH